MLMLGLRIGSSIPSTCSVPSTGRFRTTCISRPIDSTRAGLCWLTGILITLASACLHRRPSYLINESSPLNVAGPSYNICTFPRLLVCLPVFSPIGPAVFSCAAKPLPAMFVFIAPRSVVLWIPWHRPKGKALSPQLIQRVHCFQLSRNIQRIFHVAFGLY